MPEIGPIWLELIKISILAPIVFALAWFVWIQHKALRELEARRSSDSLLVVDKLLLLTEKWNETLTRMVVTVDSQKETLRDIKDILKGLRRE